MNEKTVIIAYKHFLEKHKPPANETFEFKYINVDKTKSFSFNRVADHQVYYLMTSLNGLWFKIPDMTSKDGHSQQKPFDTVWIVAKNAWVVVICYKTRVYKKAIKIPIKRFLEIKECWPKKSIKICELEKLPGIEIVYL